MSMGPTDFGEFVTPEEMTAMLKTTIPLKDLQAALRRKQNGAKCDCGNAIWALGFAACGSDMCFSCITGEADASEDYELR
jgi:hypothetical protein